MGTSPPGEDDEYRRFVHMKAKRMLSLLHLAGQGYHLEQSAELIGEHEGDVAFGFALDAQHR